MAVAQAFLPPAFVKKNQEWISAIHKSGDVTDKPDPPYRCVKFLKQTESRFRVL